MTNLNNPKELNADERIYLVKFAWASRAGKFITSDLPKTIKNNDPGRGIEYIKEFDYSTNKFKRVSKPSILNYHSWDTEGTEILTAHSYFK